MLRPDQAAMGSSLLPGGYDSPSGDTSFELGGQFLGTGLGEDDLGAGQVQRPEEVPAWPLLKSVVYGGADGYLSGQCVPLDIRPQNLYFRLKRFPTLVSPACHH